MADVRWIDLGICPGEHKRCIINFRILIKHIDHTSYLIRRIPQIIIGDQKNIAFGIFEQIISII